VTDLDVGREPDATEGEPSAEPHPTAGGRRFPLLRAIRPKQWLKNLLVVAAPLAAGTLFTSHVATRVALTFTAFCLISGAVYLVNDVLDAENDRRHPLKRLRPIAAGELSVRTAVAAATVLAAASFGLSALVGWHLVLVIALYVASSLAYNLGGKREPVLDLALVTAGFVLRALAGGVAGSAPLSGWFLLVASFGSLFMVAGKRYADVKQSAADPEAAWEVVEYTPSYLRFVWGVAATVMIMAYALWAFQLSALRGEQGLGQLSLVPFVLVVLRYAVDIDRGSAGAPEDVVIGDRWLMVLGLLWIICFALAADAG
jgi:decaprenyl-phosphate phosphoribosyltransferase